MAWFKNVYVCPECKTGWEDEWSAMSDDTCPECECSDVNPVYSEDMTVTVKTNDEGDYLVMVSADTAHEAPDYRLFMAIPNEIASGAAK
ncbi:MAG: hypothetical protein AAFY35_11265 [Pseudomonadota bacterium]